MFIKNIESKMKFTLISNLFLVLGAVTIAIGGLYYAYVIQKDAKKNVYVLDNGIPVLVHQTAIQENRLVEFKSHINTFHLLFFTIPPDDKFVKNNMEKAMYLIDDSGLKEYNNLRERGFYNQILASSSQLSISTDSISFDLKDNSFIYYGTQRIDRKSSVITRSIKTKGRVKDYDTRTDNNPHGAMIFDWTTVENVDLQQKSKNSF